MKSLLLVVVSLGVVVSAVGQGQPGGAKERVYFGTYTGNGSEGIYVADFDPATGRLGEPKLAGKATNPSFLVLHPNRRYLFSVNEVGNFEGKRVGGVTSFAIDDETGLLRTINSQSSGGAGPCHVSLNKTGQCLLVANYGGGSVASLPVRDDGIVQPPVSVINHQGKGPNKARQERAHAHSINICPDGHHAVAADLGIDAVKVYRLEKDHKLTPEAAGMTQVPPGGGPRHFAFHPNGKFGYTNNELTSTVTVFTYDGTHGILNTLETVSTLPSDFTGKSGTAEIQVHPNGKFLYVSNRGHDSLAVFAVKEDGKLTSVGHVSTGGKTPRNFCIHPAGDFLVAANQDSDSVIVFRIDFATGMPQATEHRIKLSRPVCVRFTRR
jgi:6-phosphogluconolactonase